MPRSLYMKYYIVSLLIVVIDQVSKFIVRSNMKIGESIAVIGDFFKLTYIENTGAAFSMFREVKIVLIGIPIIAIIVALVYLEKRRKKDHFTLPLALSFIIAGGIGNLIDRIIAGSVTDMFDFSIFPPIFNVADIFVCVGCFVLAIFVMRYDGEKNEIK